VITLWRVLLVDDSPLIRNAMHAALEPYGLELGHAENGEIALARASASPWDLIFLDVVMPVMDGPTALRELRARGVMTPVVLVTSVSTATVVASAVKLGRVHYIGKPFTPLQIRAVATKLLRLDASALASPPRVLLQHTDPELPARLRKLLPAHVAIESSQTLAQTIDIAEAAPHELVLFESRDPADERVAVANVIRRALPAAGVFAIAGDADPGAPWQPDEGLDGTLPPGLDDAVVRGFLYPSFLRPLVSFEGAVAHVVGFRGPAHQLPVYLAMVVRALADRWSRLDGTADLQIDVTRMPSDPDVVVALIDAVNEGMRKVGAAPSFRVNPAVQPTATQRLAQIVIV
jgi:CheY-like chemotaxis protein